MFTFNTQCYKYLLYNRVEVILGTQVSLWTGSRTNAAGTERFPCWKAMSGLRCRAGKDVTTRREAEAEKEAQGEMFMSPAESGREILCGSSAVGGSACI